MTDHAIIFAPTETGRDLTIAIGAIHHNPQSFGITTTNEYLLKAAGQMAGSLRFSEGRQNYQYEGELPEKIIDQVVGYILKFKEAV